MDLVDVLNHLIQTNTDAQKLTDVTIGTVVEADPLAIQITPDLIIPEEAILLTENVTKLDYDVVPTEEFDTAVDVYVEPTADFVSAVECDVEPTTEFVNALAVSGITCPSKIGKFKIQLPEEIGHFKIQLPNVVGLYKRPALKVNDKVIMLRVLKGQQFVVLSKVFE